MKIAGVIVYARDGFPLETFKGRPIINLLRLLLHGSPSKTWQRRAIMLRAAVGPACSQVTPQSMRTKEE